MLTEQQRLDTEISSIKAILTIQKVYERIFEYPDFPNLYRNQTLKEYALIIEDYFQKGQRATTSDVLIKCSKEKRKIFTDNIYKCIDFQDIDYFEILKYDNLEFDLNSFIRLNELQYKGKERIEEFKSGVLDILSSADSGIKLKSNSELVDGVVEEIRQIRAGKKEKVIKTNYSALDNFINGLEKGGITLIGARPSQGKTTFMLNLKNNLNKQGYNCVIFSVEMKAESLVYKDLSYESKIDSMRIATGRLSEEEFNKIVLSSNKLKRDNYIYVDNSAQTADKIILLTKQCNLKKKVDVVFIDYLTLLNFGYDKNKNNAVEETMSKLRVFAKEYDIALVILSQLNRMVEQRADKKPILSDLRDSGSIEQDANQVLFLYRPAYYFPDSSIEVSVYSNGNSVHKDNLLEVIIAKCREGRTGNAFLEYLKETHTINDTVNSNLEDLF